MNKPLSASRIKVLQTCSYLYWAKYHLKLPDKANEGSLRGNICHTVFEVLGDPRHRKHYDAIVSLQDVAASQAIERLILSYAKKNGIDSFENLDLINKMILEGLNYDFFGTKNGKPTYGLSECDFDIDVNTDKKNYRILGFIDKLFLFKKKKLAIIRDFKTSKGIFSGEEVEDNLQNLMYCLAVKYLYPEYLQRKMEFLFLKFDLNNGGLLEMAEVSTDELEGFEIFLTQVQKVINNFNEKAALADMAYHKGFGQGFTGRTVCGQGMNPNALKKDGTPMWACAAKWPFDYYVLLDEKKTVIGSSLDKIDLEQKQTKYPNSKIEKRKYEGCPAWNVKKKILDKYDPFL